jgi:hypothetical protein
LNVSAWRYRHLLLGDPAQQRGSSGADDASKPEHGHAVFRLYFYGEVVDGSTLPGITEHELGDLGGAAQQIFCQRQNRARLAVVNDYGKLIACGSGRRAPCRNQKWRPSAVAEAWDSQSVGGNKRAFLSRNANRVVFQIRPVNIWGM